jgi:hypothetical protein
MLLDKACSKYMFIKFTPLPLKLLAASLFLNYKFETILKTPK